MITSYDRSSSGELVGPSGPGLRDGDLSVRLFSHGTGVQRAANLLPQGIQASSSHATQAQTPTTIPKMMWIWTITVSIALAAWTHGAPQPAPPTELPPQSVLIDPRAFAVLGTNGPFRMSSFTQFFNPTNTSPPFFQIFDPAFLTVLGHTPSIRVVASNPTFAFAHEAPIWVPSTDEVFFASNDGGLLGMSNLEHNNQVSSISLRAVAAAIRASGSATTPLNVSTTKLDLPDTVQMTNGGTGPYNGSLVLVNSGRGALPPVLALVNPAPPHNTTVLLDNYFGRQFNSLNDVKVRPGTDRLFFTDPDYGWLMQFRPLPLMPNQVYRFDPSTSEVRVIADGFDKPNGIAFSSDGNTAFIADSAASGGFLGNNQTDPATIYAFDVDPTTEAFLNRRVFTYVDTGIADGLQLDTAGNMYAGCADGVHVWNAGGTLLGKFFLGTTSANMVFAGDGRLVIMAETAIFLAQIAANATKLEFP
ncbi:Gluconolactonase [Grifola frondosa]|uniref:Gluconolactonase n=1 Tax=Grifola frondosa TaxID=5627 RepID=A0A1C7MKC9_GRIFR|nr:Gluconolactonase [Grifola frondosa]